MTHANAALLRAYTVFHLNLCFSSVEEAQRPEVIARCYWPLLELARGQRLKLGIEASGYTLETIAALAPEWIAELKRLIADGLVEFIGSGYAQAIGPLMPARAVRANLAHGLETYKALLGIAPDLALVNEQAYSAGLVAHYRDAGFSAILMDWDNCASYHADWNPLWRYYPQRARGVDGAKIALLWTNTIAFQKLQRLAHGDIGLPDYLSYLDAQIADAPRAFALYGNDAECFGFRPGRFRTEEKLQDGEWTRIGEAFAALAADPRLALVRPSDALGLAHPLAGNLLALETPANPVPVKKQPKYNVTRWAATGRDNLGVNTLCWRAYERLVGRGVPESAPEWKELCYLWSSDFRTHITEKRWKTYRARLEAFVSSLTPPAPFPRRGRGAEFAATTYLPLCGEAGEPGGKPGEPGGGTIHRTGRWIEVATPHLRARLNCRRGLAIHELSFGGKPLLGHLPHGHFDDIALSADWYTGNCVFEAPGAPKLTDLEWCEPRLARHADGIEVGAEIATPLGPIHKNLLFVAREPRVDFRLRCDWREWPHGALRLGHFTLLPDAFDWDSLVCRTHNGGEKPETFALSGRRVDHGAPVSFLVSATSALGLTEGWAEIADARHGIRVSVDKTAAALIGLLVHKRAGNSLFCQLMLSALELDDTREPEAGAAAREFKFSVSPALTAR